MEQTPSNSYFERLERARISNEKKKNENRNNIEDIKLDILEENTEGVVYGRPAKYQIEKGIAYVIKKTLKLNVVFD